VAGVTCRARDISVFQLDAENIDLTTNLFTPHALALLPFSPVAMAGRAKVEGQKRISEKNKNWNGAHPRPLNLR
jgi:hypothetical protein